MGTGWDVREGPLLLLVEDLRFLEEEEEEDDEAE
jgi:hypothetical protein